MPRGRYTKSAHCDTSWKIKQAISESQMKADRLSWIWRSILFQNIEMPQSCVSSFRLCFTDIFSRAFETASLSFYDYIIDPQYYAIYILKRYFSFLAAPTSSRSLFKLFLMGFIAAYYVMYFCIDVFFFMANILINLKQKNWSWWKNDSFIWKSNETAEPLVHDHPLCKKKWSTGGGLSREALHGNKRAW